ncbi:crossover junction endodeoxyribonuclease RuvC, partial [Flavobacteriales bacterium]|nr:crossover junction endodeoxyribonuclease RuvC [Flavobacteriales bacterium]
MRTLSEVFLWTLLLVFVEMVAFKGHSVSVHCHLVLVQNGPTIILGIDPGTTIMGYGVVRAWSRNKVELLEMGALHLAKVKDPALKLRRIHD